MTHDSDAATRIRAAIGQLVAGPVPDGLKCDVKSLCALAGVPRATLYRSYPDLKADFERQRAVAVEASQHPDPRAAQIARLKGEIAELRERLRSKDAELGILNSFRDQALSRLAAQHDEIINLREQVHDTRSGQPAVVPLHPTSPATSSHAERAASPRTLSPPQGAG